MKRFLFILLFIPLIFLFTSSSFAEVKGLAYVNYSEQLTDEQFKRILDPQIGYIGVQVGVGQYKGEEIERIEELGKAGKKIIIQFWWGPPGRYNWSYHCLPAIAYDKEVQKDFFEGIDKTIDAIGPENVYGAHLLEELGYFGVDIDKPGNWEMNKYGIMDGNEDGDIYSHWTNPWTPSAPNLKRFNHVFKEDTGLDMNKTNWTEEENFVFRRWVEITSARAEVSFFKHLKEKYPHIKRFTWSLPSYPNWPNSDYGILREHLDGVICDPYMTINANYHRCSAIRTLLPDVELIVLLYGGYTGKDEKRAKMTAAYICGAKGIGFFEGTFKPEDKHYYEGEIRGRGEGFGGAGEGMDYQDPATWKINTSLISEFKDLPFLNKKKGPILLVTGNFHSFHVFTGLKSFDVVPSDSAYLIQLKDYPLVIVHDDRFSSYSYFYEKYKIVGPGLDEEKIKNYVQGGGILFISGTTSLPSFLKDYLQRESNTPEKQEWTYKPDLLKEKLDLNDEYHLLIQKYKIKVKSKDVREDLGYLIPYGNGIVYYAPFSHGEEKVISPLYDNLRKLIADILRGLLIYQGKKDIAKESLADKGSGYQYMEVRDRDKDITAYLQFWLGEMVATDICRIYMKPTEFKIEGADILTGEENPTFGPDKTAIIIKGK